jgi:putative ABC transport system permease protein
MRGGSDSEMMSFLGGAETRYISDAPQVLRGTGGPAASAELFVIINLPKRSTGTDANVPLRGVEPAAFRVRDTIRIVEGRTFVPGKTEVIVGRAAANAFEGLDLGAEIRMGRTNWKIVGIFEDRGGITESEIWTTAGMLQAAYERRNSFQSVCVRLESPAAFEAFKAALAGDPRLNVKVVRQTDYYVEQSTLLYNMITRLGVLVAGLMGVGAVFGALNTMYTTVSARTREIATLRALGFGTVAVIISVLLESMVLGLTGGVIGAGLAYYAFDGFKAATLNWQSFSQVAFAFEVTPALLLEGIGYALVIGFIGGLFPAIRAARLRVAAALREL